MEIIKVEKFEQMINSSVYYELGNKYYARCWNCGTPVEIDYHCTAADLRRDEPGEDRCFCDDVCFGRWLTCQYCDEDAAAVCGDGDAYRQFVLGHNDAVEGTDF